MPVVAGRLVFNLMEVSIQMNDWRYKITFKKCAALFTNERYFESFKFRTFIVFWSPKA